MDVHIFVKKETFKIKGLDVMNYESEAGWQLHPLDGGTGKAYMGTKNEQKLFMKKNTSPFLAALSLEGVSPRLVWTKRMGNGDVLTAQEWCNGRTLRRNEMSSSRVAKKLYQIHHSKALRKMLIRVDGSHLHARDLLTNYFINLVDDLREHPTVQDALTYAKEIMNQFPIRLDACVCHGDASHKNWLLSERDELYLVDWDSVVLADPAYDLGQYLARYGEQINRDAWLDEYDQEMTDDFKIRVLWYETMSLLYDIKDFYFRRRLSEMNEAITKLNNLLENQY